MPTLLVEADLLQDNHQNERKRVPANKTKHSRGASKEGAPVVSTPTRAAARALRRQMKEQFGRDVQGNHEQAINVTVGGPLGDEAHDNLGKRTRAQVCSQGGSKEHENVQRESNPIGRA